VSASPTPTARSGETVRGHALGLGLLDSEYDRIVEALGRTPNRTEVAVFAGMWSEHCSYKSTRHLLATLPREGARVLAGPGSHAGVVDVGDGWAVAFKIESHNHPSAVEPYQGAATGVGGILRDVIAQGARPCAILDSLCFGLPDDAKVRRLVEGVVAGIGGYGNAVGVPNVGGRVVFDARYEGNPLVNALAAGLVRPDRMRTARAQGEGNAVLYVGATTGCDGVLGAAFASEELGEEHVEKRSHVQVGDPFAGKRLMEACLAFDDADGLIACQDMGACGLSCAITEMAAAGGVGMDIDLACVPLREEGMSAHEILLSESQERFLFVVRRGCEDAALAHFRRGGVHAEVIGRVTGGDRVVVRRGAERVADLPAALVAGGAPATQWPIASELPASQPFPHFDAPDDLGEALLSLLQMPTVGSRQAIYSRYDQTVGNRTVRGPGQGDAAVLKLPDSTRGFALVVARRGDLCAADPYNGARAAVADALRNLACAGAEMVAATDGLNLASPRNPAQNRRIVETVRGLGDALRTIGVPVTGGNVSLYNESPSGPIPPTPMVGGLGLVADVRQVPRARVAPGEVLYLLGEPREHGGYSFYARSRTGAQGPAPAVDLSGEAALAKLLVGQVRAGRARGAKDGGGAGGLAVALAKMCVRGGTGAAVECPVAAGRIDRLLFDEMPATAWVSVASGGASDFEHACRAEGVPCRRVGAATGSRLVLRGICDVGVDALAAAFGEEPGEEGR